MDLPISQLLNYRDIVDESDKKALEQFKYEGSDDSLLYKHFTSPFCQYLVENVVPETIAPNMITFIGFQFILIPHIFIIFLYPDNDQVPNRIFYLINAVGTFWYCVFLSLHLDIR